MRPRITSVGAAMPMVRIARRHRDQQQPDRHHAEGDDQPAPAAEVVDIGAEHDGAQRPHEEAAAEDAERQHQRDEGVLVGEVGAADIRRVIGVDHKVVHFEEVAAGDAHDRCRQRPAVAADGAVDPVN